MATEDIPKVSAALSGTYFLRTVLIPIYAAVAWTISLLFGGVPGFRELLFTIVPCAFLAAPIQVFITRIFVRRERRARPRSVVPILANLAIVALIVVVAAWSTGMHRGLLISVGASMLATDAVTEVWLYPHKDESRPRVV